MLKDCIEILKEKEENYKRENHIEFYTDSYHLNNGVYFLIDLKSYKYKKMTIKTIKNNNGKENEYLPNDADLYNKFKVFDFLSQPITPKIKIDAGRLIDTTNCFSIGFKKEQYSKIVNKKSIKEYFEKTNSILKNSKYFSEFEEFETQIAKFKRISAEIIEENYLNKEIKDSDFIKIFADLPFEKYMLLKNIYDNEYAFLKEEGSYKSEIRKNTPQKTNKIPVNFISNNEKKPFNANKTRKVPAICYENTEDRTNRDLLSKYLKIPQKTKDFDNIYIEIKNDKDKGFGFEEYVVIPQNIKSISFYYDNYLNLDNESGKIPSYINNLQKLISKLYWFKFKSDDKKQKNSETWVFFENCLKLWENTGNFIPIKKIFEQSCLTLIQNGIVLDEEYPKARIQFNLYESLKTYFIIKECNNTSIKEKIRNNRKVFFMNLSESIKNKINKEETESIDNDDEFFFIAGQITKLLILKSEAEKITDSLAEGVLCSQRTDYLLNEVLKLYEKYMHAIKVLKYKNTNFSNLCSMFFKYTPKSKFVNKRMLLAGYLHSSLTKISDVKNDENKEREEI